MTANKASSPPWPLYDDHGNRVATIDAEARIRDLRGQFVGRDVSLREACQIVAGRDNNVTSPDHKASHPRRGQLTEEQRLRHLLAQRERWARVTWQKYKESGRSAATDREIHALLFLGERLRDRVRADVHASDQAHNV